MKEKISKLGNVYKKYGLVGFIKKVWAYLKANYIEKLCFAMTFNKKASGELIDDMLSQNCDRIIVWRSSFGYNVPLFQRSQHIAHNLAKKNCLVIYEVTTMTDKVKTLKKQEENLYLLNFNNTRLKKLLMSKLSASTKPKYLQIYSTDWQMPVSEVKEYMSGGFGLIYEYIDDISPEIAGTKELPINIKEKYELAMKDPQVFVVVTADVLRQDVESHRGSERMAFSSNGVDYEFFQGFDENYEFEPEFQRIIDIGKPIVCYYGALAKWFDYDLLKKIAETDKYSIVLFGIKYDESFDRNLDGEKNIYFMGPRDYKILKNYARKADILTIPFKINDITRATSPVKIFEYMGL